MIETTDFFAAHAQAKAEHPKAIVFVKVGDFYETFGEDAVTAAREACLTLTGRKRIDGTRLEMCGVPYHAVDRYVRLLIEKGFPCVVLERYEKEATPAQAEAVIASARSFSRALCFRSMNCAHCAQAQGDRCAHHDAALAQGGQEDAPPQCPSYLPEERQIAPSGRLQLFTDEDLRQSSFDL